MARKHSLKKFRVLTCQGNDSIKYNQHNLVRHDANTDVDATLEKVNSEGCLYTPLISLCVIIGNNAYYYMVQFASITVHLYYNFRYSIICINKLISKQGLVFPLLATRTFSSNNNTCY